jgi:hypothetical protein
LVVSVTSSVSGIANVGPVSTGGRAPLASQIGATVEASVAQNGVGFESGTGGSRGGASLPQLVASTFAAQAFAQESATSLLLPAPRLPQQVAAAYRTVAQAEANAAPDVQVPGLPTPLASGRVLDLTA